MFRRWQRDGTWQRILSALQAGADAAGRITCDVSVDSTITPPARRWRTQGDHQIEPPSSVGGTEPDDHALLAGENAGQRAAR